MAEEDPDYEPSAVPLARGDCVLRGSVEVLFLLLLSPVQIVVQLDLPSPLPLPCLHHCPLVVSLVFVSLQLLSVSSPSSSATHNTRERETYHDKNKQQNFKMLMIWCVIKMNSLKFCDCHFLFSFWTDLIWWSSMFHWICNFFIYSFLFYPFIISANRQQRVKNISRWKRVK